MQCVEVVAKARQTNYIQGSLVEPGEDIDADTTILPCALASQRGPYVAKLGNISSAVSIQDERLTNLERLRNEGLGEAADLRWTEGRVDNLTLTLMVFACTNLVRYATQHRLNQVYLRRTKAPAQGWLRDYS